MAGIAAVALVVGGALAVRQLTSHGPHGSDAAASDVARTGGLGHGKGTSGSGPSASPAPAARISVPASPTPSPRRTTTPASRPTTTAPPVAASTCTHPQFVTSDPTGGWTDGRYYLDNDMWNASGYSVRQTMYACSYSNWYVVASMNNDSGDGAVKTYPNAHEDFSEPAISSFHSITSTFAEKSPHRGIYEDAYDIWINGVASSGSTEVMVWTENFGQRPAGSVQGSVSLGGRTYKVWRSGSYIAFVADSSFTSGSVNLLQMFDWVIGRGWIGSSSTLGQIDYGVELVSTGGSPASFSFTNFSVATS